MCEEKQREFTRKKAVDFINELKEQGMSLNYASKEFMGVLLCALWHVCPSPFELVSFLSEVFSKATSREVHEFIIQHVMDEGGE